MPAIEIIDDEFITIMDDFGDMHASQPVKDLGRWKLTALGRFRMWLAMRRMRRQFERDLGA
jgi:hypothetical protein